MADKPGPKRPVSRVPLDTSMLPEGRDYRRVAAFAEEFVKVPRGVGARGPFRFRDWQRDLVGSVYPSEGARPRQGLWSLPRGNGKSAMAAVLSAYGLLADGVEAAQCLCVASDERQARIVFNMTRRMVELDDRLAAQVQIYADRLYVPSTDSSMFPLPADVGALQGWDPSLVIVDELHMVTPQVYEAVALSGGKRPESLVLSISTPSDHTDSIMWRLVDYGRSNPDGLALREFAAPTGCATDDEAAIAQANPAYKDFLAPDAVAQTRATSTEAAFRRYRLGQWTGSANAWLEWGSWERLAAGEGGLPEPGTRVTVGFDGSASGDSTALVGATVGPRPYMFVLGMWESAGQAPDWRVPRGEVSATVADVFDRFDVAEFAADPWGWRSEIEEWSNSWPGRITEWNTAFVARMGPATDRLAVAIREGDVSHDGDDRMTAHMSHAVAKSTPHGDVITKDKRMSTRKIDAAVAAIVAHDRAKYHHQNPRKRARVAAHR